MGFTYGKAFWYNFGVLRGTGELPKWFTLICEGKKGEK